MTLLRLRADTTSTNEKDTETKNTGVALQNGGLSCACLLLVTVIPWEPSTTASKTDMGHKQVPPCQLWCLFKGFHQVKSHSSQCCERLFRDNILITWYYSNTEIQIRFQLLLIPMYLSMLTGSVIHYISSVIHT